LLIIADKNSLFKLFFKILFNDSILISPYILGYMYESSFYCKAK